ncbi:MAG: hypothetical protein KGI71_05215 [Patescibacteria group bacterium]|nr:hypothetical protein [Patescibacteria group bacterium]
MSKAFHFLVICLLFGVAHAGTLTLSGSTCAGTVDTTTGAFTLNCGPSVTAPAPIPAPATISCAGYATQLIELPWGAIGSGNVRITTSGFANGMVIVVKFTTPNVTPTALGYGRISGVESNSQTGPIYRTAALSASPCDFSGALGPSSLSISPSPTAWYQDVGTSSYYATLSPATTYYFNVKNEYKGSPTCPAQFGNCDMFIELAKPSGW